MECSNSVPPPARDVGSPFGRVDALDREVLVVAEHDRERASVPAGGHLVDEGLEDRRVAQDQADLVRDGGQQLGDGFALGERGREGLLAEDGQPSGRGSGHDVVVGGGPGADPHRVDLVEHRVDVVAGDGAVGEREGGGAFGDDVVGGGDAGIDQAVLDELVERVGVDEADVAAADDPDADGHGRVRSGPTGALGERVTASSP